MEGRERKEAVKTKGSRSQDALPLLDIMLNGYFLLEPYLVSTNEPPYGLFLCNDPDSRNWARAPAQHSLNIVETDAGGKRERKNRRSTHGPVFHSQISRHLWTAESAGAVTAQGQRQQGVKEKLSP